MNRAGFILAKGDKRDFVLIDQAGEAHSLSRRVDGVKAAAVRERMADIDPASLPSVEQAREQYRDRHQATRREAGTARQAAETGRMQRIRKTVQHIDEIVNQLTQRFPGTAPQEAHAVPDVSDSPTPEQIEAQRQEDAAKAEVERQAKEAADQKARLDQAGSDYREAEARRIEALALEHRNRAMQLAKQMQQAEARIEGIRAEQERAAETAQRERERQRQAAQQRTDGEVRDPAARYAQALGRYYSIANPYESLARAAMHEYAAFMGDREQLTRQIASAANPGEREALELRKRIEGLDYLAFTGDRIARQSDIISGKIDPATRRLRSEQGDKYRESVTQYRAQAKALRQQLRDHYAASEQAPAPAPAQPDQKPNRAARPYRPRPPRDRPAPEATGANQNQPAPTESAAPKPALTPEQRREQRRQIIRQSAREAVQRANRPDRGPDRGHDPDHDHER